MEIANVTFGKYTVVNGSAKEFLVCFKDNKTISSNPWQSSNPLMNSLPLFVVQLSIVIFMIRLLMFVLKPLRQPRFVAEILTGILLGPSALARLQFITGEINPFEGSLLLETMGNLGLTYYMFLVGLEMDLAPLWSNIGSAGFSIAFAGCLIPMGAGVGLYYLLEEGANHSPPQGAVFWAIILTLTSFPDLARILSDLKLMHSDLGKMALTSAILNDILAWLLLVGAVSTINGQDQFYMVVPTMVFIVMFWFIVRPALCWIICHTASEKGSSTEGNYNDTHVFCILTGVVVCGFITDLCGSHSMVGAFMFGLIIPSGELGTKVMDKIEEYVTGIMLPPIFLITGLRTNTDHLFIEKTSPILVLLVIALACSAKVVSTLLVSLFLKISSRDALALGVLMNTKGVLAIIILNEGRNMKGFDNQTFVIMMASILIMTALVGPVVSFTHKSTRHSRRFKSRTIERSKPDSELRVLACLHSKRNLSGLISILHLSNASQKSPISVFAVHLVQLTGLASAMLIFHDINSKSGNGSYDSNTSEKAEDEQIIAAFQSYKRSNDAVSVQPLTAISPYATMHEDIRSFAEDKRVSLILLPFHKQSSSDGGLKEDHNTQHRQVNQNLLAIAPCSVGILVDRGLSSSLHEDGDLQHIKAQQHCVGMLFLGGPDDREALAYAWRMAGSRCIKLTVVRFVPGKETLMDHEMPRDIAEDINEQGILTTITESMNHKQIDDKYINEFRFRTMCDQSITYVEKMVDSGDQTVAAIRSTYNDFHLYIVGRGQGRTMSPLTSGLSEWSDWPELGPIGDALVASEFASRASVLVVQQSAFSRTSGPHQYSGSKDDLGIHGRGPRANRRTPAETFVNHRKKDHGYDDEDH